MGVAHTLSRTFFWSENILWKEDLSGHHATVYLSGKDSIINTPQVRAYLQEKDGCCITKDENQGEADNTKELAPAKQVNGKVDVVWCAELDHGQIFQLPTWRLHLEREILTQARAGVVHS